MAGFVNELPTLGWEPTVSLREGLLRTIELSGREMLVGATR